MIGIGLNDEKDVSVKALEAIKDSDLIYLEYYTSILQTSFENLEEFYGKKIIVADRELVEDGNEIINNAEKKKVSFLVIGDVFSATTHIGLYNMAKEKDIEVNIMNNASVLTAIGITGLELYKFGRTASIPFHNKEVKVPYKILKENQSLGLHTLFLLDLNPKNKEFLTIDKAIEYLLNDENFDENTLCVGCARLGNKDFKIISGKAKKLLKKDFGKPPHCLIVPGNLHFVEEESLEIWE